ncbi:MAG: methionyl-tRNA formyltransferase [Bacteroidetes bacterium]|nr:MAG: methionyl-tRNA formyltransferase [Bacteroidota bacterium]
MSSLLKTAILASGNLGAICIKHLHQHYPIAFVLTDKLSISIQEYCASEHIPVFVGNPRGGKATSFIKQYPVDVILSINYLFIVEEDIIHFPKKYAINFHGSLLPKYRGRTPHVWAIINNEQETGITAHLMTIGCDEGAVVYQEKIPIPNDATGASLLNTFNKRYPEITTLVMKQIATDTLTIKPQNETLATYFGKRTPEDGQINWDWHKERIYNWVRAQAAPYPGAFSFINNSKIIIHKIAFDDYGFDSTQTNGLIKQIDADGIIVKTPNGCIKITDYTLPNNTTFQIGDIIK